MPIVTQNFHNQIMSSLRALHNVKIQLYTNDMQSPTASKVKELEHQTTEKFLKVWLWFLKAPGLSPIAEMPGAVFSPMTTSWFQGLWKWLALYLEIEESFALKERELSLLTSRALRSTKMKSPNKVKEQICNMRNRLCLFQSSAPHRVRDHIAITCGVLRGFLFPPLRLHLPWFLDFPHTHGATPTSVSGHTRS